ncbi:MAG TPA: TPM domain-containing protein [Verrucomicrobiae bacterium]|nr:TPM domain-containing protein [Verrucomicrobiae bacterium]
MNAPEFVQQLREDEIAAAIRAAEQKTSGELRVFISRQTQVADPVAAAHQEFNRLGMADTRERNGVLIYLAPCPRKFAVIGDTGIHERCGASFWQHLAESMSARFQAGQFTEGIVEGINRAGELLAIHFPRRPDDTDELPNRVERD